jgi:hypothetical protein
VPLDRERWIGVCPDPDGGWLRDHCLVMAYDRLLFDPSGSLDGPPGTDVRHFGPGDVAYGISFDPTGQEA